MVKHLGNHVTVSIPNDLPSLIDHVGTFLSNLVMAFEAIIIVATLGVIRVQFSFDTLVFFVMKAARIRQRRQYKEKISGGLRRKTRS